MQPTNYPAVFRYGEITLHDLERYSLLLELPLAESSRKRASIINVRFKFDHVSAGYFCFEKFHWSVGQSEAEMAMYRSISAILAANMSPPAS